MANPRACPIPLLQHIGTVSSLLLIFLLGITYATIAPMILPFVTLYMLYGYYVFRFQLVYTRTPRYESGGQFFPLMFSRLCVVCANAALHSTVHHLPFF